jgi:anti-sigma-K factor RskA
MKCKEIIVLLESKAFGSLNEDDLSGIQIHIVDCSDCDQAFQSARVSSVLLHERAVAEFEPSPFFQTRVMANWRERQAAGEGWAWSRLWRSAGALASSMVATVAALAVLTFVVPGNDVASGSLQATSLNSYSAEEVLLEQSAANEEPSDGQLLSSIYGGDE